MNFMAIWQWNHHPTRNTTGPRDHSPWLRTGPRKSRCEGNSKGRLTCTMGHGEQEQYQPTKKSPWIIGEWVTWENIYMPFFGLRDKLFESLNHDSLQSRPNESRIRKVEEPTSRYWRTIRFLENEHEQWELKNFNMSATQRNNMEHIQPSQLKQTSLIIVIHSDS